MSRPVILNWTAEQEEYWNGEEDEVENYLIFRVNGEEVARRRLESWYRYPEDAITDVITDLFKKVFSDGTV